MPNAFEPSWTMYTAQLRTTRHVIDACIGGVERADHLLLQAAKDLLHDEIEQAASLARVRTPEDLVAFAQTRAQPAYERMVARNTGLLQALAQTGAETISAAQDFMLKAGAEAEGGAMEQST